MKGMTSGPIQPHTAFLKCLLALCLQKANSNQIFIKENTVKREFLAADRCTESQAGAAKPKSDAHDVGVSGTPTSSSH